MNFSPTQYYLITLNIALIVSDLLVYETSG